MSLAPREHDPLAVRAPHGVALHERRIVRARQGLERVRFAIVYRQDPFDRKEELRKGKVIDRREHGLVSDHADHIPAVRRHLRHQALAGQLFFAFEVVPGDDPVARERHLARHRQDRISPLVAAVVHVHPQHLAVGREGVAIAAYRQLLQDDRRRFPRRDRSKPPADPRRILDGIRKGQIDLAEENRGAHFVRRRAEREGARGRHPASPSRRQSQDDRLGLSASRPLLDRLPGFHGSRPGGPLARKEHRLAAVRKLEHDQPPDRHSRCVRPTKCGRNALRGKQRIVEGVDDLQAPDPRVGVVGCQQPIWMEPRLAPDHRGDNPGNGQSRRCRPHNHLRMWYSTDDRRAADERRRTSRRCHPRPAAEKFTSPQRDNEPMPRSRDIERYRARPGKSTPSPRGVRLVTMARL